MTRSKLRSPSVSRVILQPFVGGDEDQQQPDRVAVAAHRGRPQPLDRDQVVDEERMQRAAPAAGSVMARLRHAGSAKASNRRLASASSPGVMVR